MKLATLRTAAGLRPVGVHDDGGTPRFVDLAAVDPSLPTCLKAILADEEGLVRAATACEIRSPVVAATAQAPRCAFRLASMSACKSRTSSSPT